MSSSPRQDLLERVFLFFLIASCLTGLGLTEWKRNRPSFQLEVFSERPPRPLSPPRIFLNRASPEELTRLPGIGPRLAARIVEARTRKGSFVRLEELLDVNGIGPALLDRIRPYLELK